MLYNDKRADIELDSRGRLGRLIPFRRTAQTSRHHVTVALLQTATITLRKHLLLVSKRPRLCGIYQVALCPKPVWPGWQTAIKLGAYL